MFELNELETNIKDKFKYKKLKKLGSNLINRVQVFSKLSNP